MLIEIDSEDVKPGTYYCAKLSPCKWIDTGTWKANVHFILEYCHRLL